MGLLELKCNFKNTFETLYWACAIQKDFMGRPVCVKIDRCSYINKLVRRHARTPVLFVLLGYILEPDVYHLLLRLYHATLATDCHQKLFLENHNLILTQRMNKQRLGNRYFI